MYIAKRILTGVIYSLVIIVIKLVFIITVTVTIIIFFITFKARLTLKILLVILLHNLGMLPVELLSLLPKLLSSLLPPELHRARACSSRNEVSARASHTAVSLQYAI